LSDYTKAKDDIKNDSELSPEEKRIRIKEIDATISDIAYNAVQMTLEYEK
jgi:uncharacterized membrane protein YukC